MSKPEDDTRLVFETLERYNQNRQAEIEQQAASSGDEWGTFTIGVIVGMPLGIVVLSCIEWLTNFLSL